MKYAHQENRYRQTPKAQHFFRKTVVFSTICLGSPTSQFLEVCLNSEYMWWRSLDSNFKISRTLKTVEDTSTWHTKELTNFDTFLLNKLNWCKSYQDTGKCGTAYLFQVKRPCAVIGTKKSPVGAGPVPHFVPRPCWYIYSVKKERVWAGRLELTSLGVVLILSYTPWPWLPRMRAQIMKYWAILWVNVKYQHGRRTKYCGTNREAFPFPEVQFSRGELHFEILISFCYSVVSNCCPAWLAWRCLCPLSASCDCLYSPLSAERLLKLSMIEL